MTANEFRRLTTSSMKIEVLNRNPKDYIRETKYELRKVHRNLDKNLHPMQEAQEYTRAVKFAKMERMFAKPFVSSLDGHRDGVCLLERHSTRLPLLGSGSCDGEIRIWDLMKSSCTSQVNAHVGSVKGMCFHPDGNTLISVGIDSVINHWKLNEGKMQRNSVLSIVHSSILLGISHNFSSGIYATAGNGIHLWDSGFTVPISHYTWGVDTISSVKFNPIETNILISLGSDRDIILYDIRKPEPISKVYLAMKSSSISWHPLEAYTFIVGNEDSNIYRFDSRNLGKPIRTYGDHANAVLDVDFSPTGQEFVSASYDKSLRIFPTNEIKCRDVYYTKRMQRIFCARFSGDSHYIICGSDEMNIRLWKAHASEKQGYLRPREMASIRYAESLKERFKNHPEIRKISKKRNLPKSLHNLLDQKKTHKKAVERRDENIRLFKKQVPPEHKTVISVEDEE